ncbi:(2Fe-2S)-binding protein [Bradyrhizobium australafricanum]|uniref:(2Fe-2S)-binding protein n=1 Tax=Bradyrhizobium australafricanum TaxID=2821406 RepID=UPI001CE31E49|nr:(2Fe-2S)-binding protein [Bradyrhizobium australafricanum]MCA6100543.1 (2Fe-2S)-binding protein [Bradyrhizobium australafricanum]
MIERFRAVLNGKPVEAEIDSRALLIEAVRDCGARGARIGCLTGDCGACSIVLDGRLVKSCLVLAVSAEGSDIVTIEGSRHAIADELRDAFVACSGFQCGYCTSGMIMVAIDLLQANPSPTEADIRRAVSGNLCRCTGYEDIVRAIGQAAEALRNKCTGKAENGG